MAQNLVRNDFARLALERLERSRAAQDAQTPFPKDFFADTKASHVEDIEVGIVQDLDMTSDLYRSWLLGDDDDAGNAGDTAAARAADFSAHESPKPLEIAEQTFRHRGRSISFDPHATLDNGTRLPLQDPPPHATPGTRGPPSAQRPLQNCSHNKRAADNDSLADESSPASSPLMLAQRHHGASGAFNEKTSTDASLRPRRTARPNIATASPVHDGIHTPHSPFAQSPTTMSSPVFTSLPEAASPEPWTVFRQSSLKSVKNFSSSRQTSLRRMSRHSSKRSASSSFSPASAFLSRWGSADNSAIPEIDAEGQSFGDNNEYIIGQQLGQGGSGIVKEAFLIDPEGERRVFAVKIVKRPVSAPDKPESPATEHFVQQLEHEISMWRHLENKHIVALHSVFEAEIATFCVMDLSNGGSLYDLILQSRKTGCRGIDPAFAKSYAFQLACALRYLHQDIRVVHRDVKLENCLLHHDDPDTPDTPGLLKLGDFGLSDFMTLESPAILPAGERAAGDDGDPPDPSHLTGSLDYVPPEALHALRAPRPEEEQSLTPSVDMWAFGVCVFAILTGERPFKHALQARLVELILAAEWSEETVRAAPSCRTSDDRPATHAEDIVRLVAGCLNPDPRSRWTITRVLESPWFADCGDPCL